MKRSGKLGDYDYVAALRKLNPLSVTLTGGEPTINKQLPEAVRRIKKSQGFVYIGMVTHGSLMTVEKAMALWDAGLDHISISLNYIGREHDEERGIEGLYEHITTLVPQLTARGVNVIFNTVIMRDNLDHVVPIAHLARTMGAKVSYSCYSDFKNGNETHLVDPAHAERLESVIEDLIFQKSRLGNIVSSAWYLRRIPAYFQDSLPRSCSAAGKWLVQLTPDGDVKPCAELPVTVRICRLQEGFQEDRLQPVLVQLPGRDGIFVEARKVAGRPGKSLESRSLIDRRQLPRQYPPGMGERTGDFLGRPRGNHVTAPVTAFRSEIDDPVGRLDDVQVVLDHQHRIPLVYQPVQDLQQLADVVEVEPRGRLVQQVDGLAGARPGEFLRKLDPLRLATRKRNGRLAELDVVETHVVQRLEHATDAGHVLEMLEGLGHGHLQRVGDGSCPCRSPPASPSCSASRRRPRRSSTRLPGNAFRSCARRAPGRPRNGPRAR